MTTIALKNIENNFSALFDSVIQNRDELTVVSESGSVVIIEQNDWNRIQETLNLLRDNKSLECLLEGHKLRDAGLAPNSKTTDQAFNDL